MLVSAEMHATLLRWQLIQAVNAKCTDRGNALHLHCTVILYHHFFTAGCL